MDDESERKSKLQAGKEALLAYQKKKAKKGKKKSECEESSDISKSEATSFTSNDFTTSIHFQSESPIPWSENSLTSVDASPSLSLRHRPDLSSTGVTDLVTVESSVTNGVENKDADNQSPQHRPEPALDPVTISVNTDSHLQPTTDFDISEHTDFGHSPYSVLQKQLADAEMECKALQDQLAKLSHKHKIETEHAINQNRIQEQTINEHVSHIARLSAELANAQLHEQDEAESLRIKLIKDQLKDMYEQERNALLLKHKLEIEQLSDRYQRQQEDFKKNVEQQANNEIQKIHSDYKAAYDHIFAEKTAIETEANTMKMKFTVMENRLEEVMHEKTSSEEKCQLLMQSHADEIRRIQCTANAAEESVLVWKQKVTALEDKVNELERNQGELYSQLDKTTMSLVHTQEELSRSKDIAQQYQLESEELKSKQLHELQQLEEQHQAEKEELEDRLTTQLENSWSEASSDKASLDLAEVHMKNLEKQLKEYRLQEQNFQNKLDQQEQQHAKELESIRLQCEAERIEEINKITTNYTSQIEALSQKLQKAVTSNQDIDVLKSDHERSLIELQHLHEESKRAMREEQEETHEKQLQALVRQHSNEVSTLKAQMKEEMEHARKDWQKKFTEDKEAEIQSLKQKHSANIQRLRESLLESKDSPLAVSEAQVAKLEAELHEERAANQDFMSQLEHAQRNFEEAKQNLVAVNLEKKQLAEQLVKCEEAVKVLNVDLSIAVNSAEQDRYTSESLQQQLAQCKERLSEISAALESKEQKIVHLSQEVIDKQSVIANLTLQCEAVKKELNQASQNEREISMQLNVIKDEHNKLHSNYDAATLMLNAKNAEVVQIRTELDATCHQITVNRQMHEHALAESLSETEKLKLKACNELEQQKQMYEDTIHQLSSTITDLQMKLDAILTENDTLKQLHHEAVLRKEPPDSTEEQQLECVCMERDQLLLKVKQFENSQVAFEEERNKLELRILNQEKQIQDFLMQLNAKEAALIGLQKELSRQCINVEPRENGSSKMLQGLTHTSDHFDSLGSEKGCIEDSLSTARETLVTKLKEKADLERDLNFHRTELEHRLAEKQRLEELLFEKSRFEQELQSQKEQLQSELHDIELRLQTKEKEEHDEHHFERKVSSKAKDSMLLKEDKIAMRTNRTAE